MQYRTRPLALRCTGLTVAVAAATTVTLGLAAPSAASASAGTWTQSFGGAAHHNENQRDTAIARASVAKLRAGWRLAKTNTADRVPPAVVGDTAYTVYGDTPATERQQVAALRTSNGKPRWKRSLPAGYNDTEVAPAVAGGLVVVALGGDGAGQPGLRPALDVAYSAKTGRMEWKSTEPKSPAGVDNTDAQYLTVADKRVFTVVDDGVLTSRNLRTGHIQWRVTVSTYGDAPGSGGEPTYGDERLYVQGDGGTLTALNPANGNADWIGDADIGQANMLSESAGRVVVGGTSGAAAFRAGGCTGDTSDCKPLWVRRWSVQEDVSLSALDPADAFFIGREAANTGGDKTNIYAVNAKTGRELWQGSVPLGDGLNDLTRVSNVLLATSEANLLYAFPVHCTTPCTAIWTHRIVPASATPSPAADPVIVGHRVFVAVEQYSLATLVLR